MVCKQLFQVYFENKTNEDPSRWAPDEKLGTRGKVDRAIRALNWCVNTNNNTHTHNTLNTLSLVYACIVLRVRGLLGILLILKCFIIKFLLYSLFLRIFSLQNCKLVALRLWDDVVGWVWFLECFNSSAITDLWIRLPCLSFYFWLFFNRFSSFSAKQTSPWLCITPLSFYTLSNNPKLSLQVCCLVKNFLFLTNPNFTKTKYVDPQACWLSSHNTLLITKKSPLFDYNCPPPESLTRSATSWSMRDDYLHFDLLVHSLNTKIPYLRFYMCFSTVIIQ